MWDHFSAYPKGKERSGEDASVYKSFAMITADYNQEESRVNSEEEKINLLR